MSFRQYLLISILEKNWYHQSTNAGSFLTSGCDFINCSAAAIDKADDIKDCKNEVHLRNLRALAE